MKLGRPLAALALSDQYDLLVLDELNYAAVEGYVSEEEILELLRQKPERLSVIITGRGASLGLIDAADTVTEMRCIKHAFARWLPGEEGHRVLGLALSLRAFGPTISP